VLGFHTIMAKRAGVAIAQKLGNALLAPILPFSIAGSHLNPNWPGSVNLSGEVFSAVNEAVVDSMVVNGFKHIVLMADHGGGQTELRALAEKLDAKYAPQGIRVHFCSDVYTKSATDVNAYIAAHHLPAASHGGLYDTSELLYLGGDTYVRRDKLVAGDPVVPPGQVSDPVKPKLNNGVTGDPRRATAALGKIFFDLQVNNAVAEIQRLVGTPPVSAGTRIAK
jgi:creatinine amidohydrolase